MGDKRNSDNQFAMYLDTDITLDSVILSLENREKIDKFIEEHEYRNKIKEYGLRPVNRLLMYGDSGTGKTFLSKALCNHIEYKMLCVDIAKALSNDSVASNLTEVFEEANEGGYMVFLDECDSIAWNRDYVGTDSGIIRRATNSVFQLMDQLSYDSIIVAATNMLHRLDPAFARRFDVKMEFKRPTGDMLKTIEKFMLPQFELVDDASETLRSIVKHGSRLSYYAIQGIVEGEMKSAVIRGDLKVHTSAVMAKIAENTGIKIRFDVTDEI